jgi:hypothetical protein
MPYQLSFMQQDLTFHGHSPIYMHPVKIMNNLSVYNGYMMYIYLLMKIAFLLVILISLDHHMIGTYLEGILMKCYSSMKLLVTLAWLKFL